jgi:murein DD-endopeptidase MepM/ murein hydrolase activator NlpD
MKGIFKKTLLTTAIIGITLASSSAHATRWCGQPICPGDVVFDKTKFAANEYLQNIKNNFVDNMLIPIIKEGMAEQLKLLGQQMTGQVKTSVQEIGKKTETITNLANIRTLADLQPTPEEACSLLTWQDYMSTDSKEIANNVISDNNAKIATRAIRGESESNQNIINRQYRQLEQISNANGDRSIYDIDTLYSNDTLNEDDARDALLAIDILTNPERDIDRVMEIKSGDDYKSEYVTNARKALIINIVKQYLSDPVIERLGVGNAQTSLESMQEGDEFAPTEPTEGGSSFLEELVDDMANNEEVEESGEESFPPSSGEGVLSGFPAAPLKYTRISSHFNPSRVHPVTGEVRPHKGVDFAAPVGTPIYAPADGNILKAGLDSAGLNNGFGRMLIISHGNNLYTWYGHLDAWGEGMSTGTDVKKGDLVAYSGNTGISSGPHLHYEIRVGGVPGEAINPIGRFGISNAEATDNLTREILGDHRFDYGKRDGWAEEGADAMTLSGQALRKELIAEGLSFERAMQEYRDLEKLKFIIALESLTMSQ